MGFHSAVDIPAVRVQSWAHVYMGPVHLLGSPGIGTK